jgi:hypothetical protein
LGLILPVIAGLFDGPERHDATAAKIRRCPTESRVVLDAIVSAAWCEPVKRTAAPASIAMAAQVQADPHAAAAPPDLRRATLLGRR